MLEYSVQDRSLLLPHYKRFLIEPFLPAIPAWLSPNVITHAGHLLSLAALGLLLASVKMSQGAPFFVVAALVNVYLWCDNADGGHARRTGQCSATGEFLDHGLDLLNATYVAVMTVLTLGGSPFWSVAAAVVVPAAAAVTYWEQAETGVFQLGMLNQIESIACLTVALCVRGLFGAEVFSRVNVAILVFVTAVALLGIVKSAYRVARKRGRMLPFVAPLAFGAAIAFAAATRSLPLPVLIGLGAAGFIFFGIRQLTLRVRKERPRVESGVLVAAAAVVAVPNAAIATVIALAFAGLALVHALRGLRAVGRLDRA